MTLDQISSGTRVFLDANTLIYHFTGEPTYGSGCTRLIERIEQHDLEGYTTSSVISDTAHRMMTIEAVQNFAWPIAGIAARLRKHYSEIPKLTLFQQAIQQVPQLNIRVWDTTFDMVLAATEISLRYELLSGDALIVAAMKAHGFSQLASADSDFDRVPSIKRFALA